MSLTYDEMREAMARAMSDYDGMYVEPQPWHRDYADAALAAMRAAGWVPVPVEATEEMVNALRALPFAEYTPSSVYRAMLAASPAMQENKS